jgi:hypothetical protein
VGEAGELLPGQPEPAKLAYTVLGWSTASLVRPAESM